MTRHSQKGNLDIQNVAGPQRIGTNQERRAPHEEPLNFAKQTSSIGSTEKRSQLSSEYDKKRDFLAEPTMNFTSSP